MEHNQKTLPAFTSTEGPNANPYLVAFREYCSGDITPRDFYSAVEEWYELSQGHRSPHYVEAYRDFTEVHRHGARIIHLRHFRRVLARLNGWSFDPQIGTKND